MQWPLREFTAQWDRTISIFIEIISLKNLPLVEGPQLILPVSSMEFLVCKPPKSPHSNSNWWSQYIYSLTLWVSGLLPFSPASSWRSLLYSGRLRIPHPSTWSWLNMENLYSTKLKRCLSVHFVGWWVPVQRFHEDSLNLEALWISNILIHPVLQNHLQFKDKKKKAYFLLQNPVSTPSIPSPIYYLCLFLKHLHLGKSLVTYTIDVAFWENYFHRLKELQGEGCLPWFQHYSWLASEESHADGQNDSPAFGEWVALLSGALWSISLFLPLSVLTIPSSKGHAEWSEEWHLHQTTSAFTPKSKLQWHLNCTALSWIPSSPVSFH